MKKMFLMAAMAMLNCVRACLRSANLKRALACSCLLAALMCGLAACSSSDDENGGQPVKKSDPALIGDWIEWTDASQKEINQAISFLNRGDMMMYLQKVNSGVTGGWYHAEYTITGDGTMTLDATRVRMVEFNWFDDCEWYALDPVHLPIYLSYRISGDELHIVFADSGKEIVLKKFASSSN